MSRRELTVTLVQSVLRSPEQRASARAGREVFQSRMDTPGVPRLVRVFVDTDRQPPVVVTAYKTGRIQRYRRPA